MPVLAALLLITQVAFAYHAIRHGKEYFWIYIIIFLPGIGCILYFLTQILPVLSQSHGVRSAKNTLVKAIDPRRELRNRKELLEISDNLENRIQLADECLEAELYDDAVSLYTSCLGGVDENNPNTMLKLAEAYFHKGDYSLTKETLDRLIVNNPDYRSTTGHLLYARALEALNMTEQAINEYDIVASNYPGEEARVRYALLLKKLGHNEKAIELFKECLLRAKRAPKYYAKKEREWVEIARQNC